MRRQLSDAMASHEVRVLQQQVSILQQKLQNQARQAEFDADDRLAEQAEQARVHAAKLAEAEMAHVDMAGQLDAMRMELYARNLAVAELSAELEERDEHDAVLEDRLAAAAKSEKAEADALRAKVAELEQTLSSAARSEKAQRAKAGAELQRVRKQCDLFEAEVEAANEQLANYQAAADAAGDGAADTVDSLREDVLRANRATKKAEKLAEVRSKECERREVRIEKLQGTIQSLREELQNQSITVETVSPGGSRSADHSDALQEQIGELGHRLAKKTKECATLTKKLAAATAKGGAAAAAAAAAAEDNALSAAVEEEFEKLQVQLKKVTKERNARGKELAAAEQKAAAASAEAEALRTTNAELSAEVERLTGVPQQRSIHEAAPAQQAKKPKSKKRAAPAQAQAQSPTADIVHVYRNMLAPKCTNDDVDDEAEELHQPASSQRRRANVKTRKPRVAKASKPKKQARFKGAKSTAASTATADANSSCSSGGSNESVHNTSAGGGEVSLGGHDFKAALSRISVASLNASLNSSLNGSLNGSLNNSGDGEKRRKLFVDNRKGPGALR